MGTTALSGALSGALRDSLQSFPALSPKLSAIHLPSSTYKPGDKWPVVVVYGGIFYKGHDTCGQWILSQLPEGFKKNHIVVAPLSYNTQLEPCLNEFLTFVPSSCVSSYSLCGFSRGAGEVFRYRTSRSWKILGLIDPASPTWYGFNNSSLDDKIDSVRAVYWPNNWGSNYRPATDAFAKHLVDNLASSQILIIDTPHEGMPNIFFDYFGSAF